MKKTNPYPREMHIFKQLEAQQQWQLRVESMIWVLGLLKSKDMLLVSHVRLQVFYQAFSLV